MTSVAMSSAIRALLVTEEEGEFDRAYRQALSEAADSLELTGVLDMLEHWCRRAINSTDPLSYRMDTVFGAVHGPFARVLQPAPPQWGSGAICPGGRWATPPQHGSRFADSRNPALGESRSRLRGRLYIIIITYDLRRGSSRTQSLVGN